MIDVQKAWWNQAAFVAVLTAVLAVCGIALVQEAGAAVAPADLPDVLAKVNGKPILKKDVPASPDAAGFSTPALERAIEQQLIAQQAATEGLDENPQYQGLMSQARAQAVQLTWLKRRPPAMLAFFYSRMIPQLTRVGPEDVPAADIDAHLAANPDSFGRLAGAKLRLAAARTISTRLYTKTQAEWLRMRLSNCRFSVNGKEIPPAVIQTAVDAMTAQGPDYTGPAPVGLFDKVKEMAIKQEAKRQGVRSRAIKKDSDLVEAILTEAMIEIETPGREIVRSHIPHSLSMTDEDGKIEVTGYDSSLFLAMKESILAAEAREKGIDKDPAFQQKLGPLRAQIELLSAHNEADALADAYYACHGLGAGDVEVTDAELDQWYLAIMRALMDRGQTGGQEAFRAYLDTARRNSQKEGRLAGGQAANLADTETGVEDVEVTGAELDEWYLAIMQALMNQGQAWGQDAFRAFLETARLNWQREGYMQALRQAADIEVLVELPAAQQ